MTMIEVRKLTLDDYDAIMTVWNASGLKIKPTGRESRTAMRQQMSVGVQTILGAFIDGQLAGVVLATHDSRKGWINRLGVSDAFKRQGIGRALVQDLEAQVRARGGLTITLGTDDESNLTSLGGVDLYPDPLGHLRQIRNLHGHPYEFYQKLGFVLTGVLPDANGFGRPDIFMAKRVQ